MKARFVHLKADIDKTVSMPAPKRIEDINAWYKSARKVIPEIPDVSQPFWFIRKYTATTNLVVFELDNGKPTHTKEFDFAHVLIYRRASSLG